jgi:PIN domain nuclease of toxin-antitoxin system
LVEALASVAYLDTHVVAWLYAGRVGLLSKKATSLLNRSELRISPMVALELFLLFETGRTTVSGEVVVRDLEHRIGLRTCDEPFPAVMGAAVLHSWARDPFDRVIVGHAALHDRPLVTKDEVIRSHYRRAVW